MQKLVIYRSEANLRFSEQTTNPHEINVTWVSPEVYGVIWAVTYKDDIVMLVEEDG